MGLFYIENGTLDNFYKKEFRKNEDTKIFVIGWFKILIIKSDSKPSSNTLRIFSYSFTFN